VHWREQFLGFGFVPGWEDLRLIDTQLPRNQSQTHPAGLIKVSNDIEHLLHRNCWLTV